MRQVELGELYVTKGGSLNPSKFLEETFEYYSIPAYDTGKPEIIAGAGIGSSKKVFQPNDVLLSRIVPHIRRCWVVGENNGVRQIGSSEWIIFRSDDVEPLYLKYFLMSNAFNAKFLMTIKGVGGSLMRADPKQVARFKIPLPPLNQQKQIAKILDTADTYRQKTKALIAKYDELTQSLFLDMFGDVVANNKKWETKTIEEIAIKEKKAIKRGPFGGALKKEIFVEEGYLVYEQYHALNNDFTMARYFIDEKKFNELKGFEVKPKDIIISCSGVYLGKLAIIPPNAKKGIINQALLKLTLDENIMTNDFFVHHFTQKNFRETYFDANRGAGVPNFPPMATFKRFPFCSTNKDSKRIHRTRKSHRTTKKNYPTKFTKS